ncbi:MAG TPA: hypothetical protein VMV54_02350, partial [Acidocella sp.]|nr:hypothetical protein [Acidocella sp.]
LAIDYYGIEAAAAGAATAARQVTTSTMTAAESAGWQGRAAQITGYAGANEFTSQMQRQQVEDAMRAQREWQASMAERGRRDDLTTYRQTDPAWDAQRQYQRESHEQVQEFGDALAQATGPIDRFSTAVITAAASLAEITGGPQFGGAGGEALGDIAALLPEDQRAAFLQATGQTRQGEVVLDEVFANISQMPADQRTGAATRLAAMLNQPDFDMAGMMSGDVMNALGLYGGAGGGTGGTPFTVGSYTPTTRERMREGAEGTSYEPFEWQPDYNTGGGTLLGIQARLAAQGQYYTLEQLAAAAGTTNPSMVQPGTYTMGGAGGAGGWMDYREQVPEGQQYHMPGGVGYGGDEAAGITNEFEELGSMIDGVADSVATLQGDIASLDGMKATIDIELVAKDDGLSPALRQMLAGFVELEIRRNGGVAPGTDSRAQPRNTVSSGTHTLSGSLG